MVDIGFARAELPEVAKHLHELTPDYFSLRVRQAVHGELALELYPDDPLAGVAEPDEAELFAGEATELATHPEVVEAGALVADAEAAVFEAEDAGGVDEVSMRRLDRARAAERAVLVRLQKARSVAHTVRSESRAAQVVALRPRLGVIRGGEAA